MVGQQRAQFRARTFPEAIRGYPVPACRSNRLQQIVGVVRQPPESLGCLFNALLEDRSDLNRIDGRMGPQEMNEQNCISVVLHLNRQACDHYRKACHRSTAVDDDPDAPAPACKDRRRMSCADHDPYHHIDTSAGSFRQAEHPQRLDQAAVSRLGHMREQVLLGYPEHQLPR